jgi:hydrogenase nickel incorporation protein HypA/HybF
MHELALPQSILGLIRGQAERNCFQRVLTVRLAIGTLSHVEPHAIEFCFEAVCRGTLAEGARLEISRPAGRAHCLPCAAVVAIASRDAPCPTCGSHQWVLVGGDELQVTELEVE